MTYARRPEGRWAEDLHDAEGASWGGTTRADAREHGDLQRHRLRAQAAFEQAVAAAERAGVEQAHDLDRIYADPRLGVSIRKLTAAIAALGAWRQRGLFGD